MLGSALSSEELDSSSTEENLSILVFERKATDFVVAGALGRPIRRGVDYINIYVPLLLSTQRTKYLISEAQEIEDTKTNRWMTHSYFLSYSNVILVTCIEVCGWCMANLQCPITS